MDSALIWYALWLLIFATVFWAAVWWWLPALFRGRDRDPGEPRRDDPPRDLPADRDAGGTRHGR